MKLFSQYFLIILTILIYSSTSWSAVKDVKGIMTEKKSSSFLLKEPLEGCEISINRNNLDDILDDFISTNWNPGEVLRIGVPANAVSTLCNIEEIEEFRQSASAQSEQAGSSSPPLRRCDSSEYQALKARVNDYNSKSTDGSSMLLPSCSGNDNDSIPLCDSEEHQREKERALASGDPIGPCRGGSTNEQEEASRGTR